MPITVALAGDTMLGRGVAAALASGDPTAVVAPAVVEITRAADLVVLNLECCISEGGRPWPDPRKPFFFRAPPAAVETLAHLGVDAVTLANNHTLDYSEAALRDTLAHLDAAGIARVGAGLDDAEARAPLVLEAGGIRLGVVGLSDHPADYAAAPDRPGIAHADLRSGVPAWVPAAIDGLDADAVLVTPHWGPNMTRRPPAYVRRAAEELRGAGATLVAGHSAHVFHGAADGVLYDLGDFLDDYAVDADLRNDLGLLFLVTLDRHGPLRVEAVPLRLDFCHTRLADPEDAKWIARRFVTACAELGTEATVEGDRLVVVWR
jgi:poly-gamma-glutamate capsule biosynthesis protein CapA/YwtB (metallophosphatase superfamily)